MRAFNAPFDNPPRSSTHPINQGECEIPITNNIAPMSNVALSVTREEEADPESNGANRGPKTRPTLSVATKNPYVAYERPRSLVRTKISDTLRVTVLATTTRNGESSGRITASPQSARAPASNECSGRSAPTETLSVRRAASMMALHTVSSANQ